LKRDVELNLLRCVISLSPPTTHPPTPTPLGFSMNPDRQQTLKISVICCPPSGTTTSSTKEANRGTIRVQRSLLSTCSLLR
jgi:hypothetical protein